MENYFYSAVFRDSKGNTVHTTSGVIEFKSEMSNCDKYGVLDETLTNMADEDLILHIVAFNKI